MVAKKKFGARVYQVGSTILVKQTVQKGSSSVYVIDFNSDGYTIERHVKQSDAKGIADAIREALAGRLGPR